jgi:hypothetical protein
VHLCGDEKSGGRLTTIFEESKKRRGRRTPLSDAQLHNRRDQFVQIFEAEWGELGWELPRCKKGDDLALILRPLAESPSWIAQVVELFCRSSSEPFSTRALRQVRSELRKLVEPLQLADETLRGAKDRLHGLERAFPQARGRALRTFKRVRKQRRKELWKKLVEHREFADSEKRLKARLVSLEGSFARQELMRFVRSKRYEVMPLNLANAVAGFPHMGWRQSMRRNRSTPPVTMNGRSYQIFKAIRYLAESSNKETAKDLVKSFRESIRLLPSRYKAPQEELAKNWFYLERAIRHAYRTKAHLKALAFEITKQYFKQILSWNQVHIVLAEQFKLELSKQPKRVPLCPKK